jgi:cell division septation protein DedD
VTDAARRIKEHGVSVGLFAVPENAERIQAKLVAAGLPVLQEPIESAKGPLTRVRVGPFERRDQAQAAAARVRALGLEARVDAP